MSDTLKHYGIKGMKWGVKKEQKPSHADASSKADIKTRVKKDKIRTVSNADLAKAINRMQLEQNYKRLAVNEESGIVRFIKSTMLEIGKREVQVQAGKAAAKFVAKKLATGGAA